MAEEIKNLRKEDDFIDSENEFADADKEKNVKENRDKITSNNLFEEQKNEKIENFNEAKKEEELQKAPYSRLGGPLFISLPKYKQIGNRIYQMKKRTEQLKRDLEEIKEMRNRGTKILCETLDNLETIEENIGHINETLKVKAQ